MNLTLTGYRATGKTTVAKLLAARLACGWADADDLVGQLAGRSIDQIFRQNGEAEFRKLESQALAQLARGTGIISVGGGAILSPDNRRIIREYGAVVWLTATPKTILTRMNADPQSSVNRPPLTNLDAEAEVVRILQERTPYYKECASIEVATDDRSPESVLGEILRRLGDSEQ